MSDHRQKLKRGFKDYKTAQQSIDTSQLYSEENNFAKIFSKHKQFIGNYLDREVRGE